MPPRRSASRISTKLDIGTLDPAVGGADGRRDGPGLDDTESVAGDPPPCATKDPGDVGVDRGQEEPVEEGLTARLEPGGVGLLDAGHVAADQNEVFPGVDGAGVGDLDRRALDHGVSGAHPDRDRVEFEQRDGRLHAFDPPHTIRRPPAMVIRRSREKERGRVRPSPVGLAIENEV